MVDELFNQLSLSIVGLALTDDQNLTVAQHFLIADI